MLRPNNPLYNLALEEYIYRNCSLATLTRHVYVWINYPSVIVGRMSREGIDYSCSAAKRIGIPVYRRFTGGGAVYHDEGVLSITLIGEKVNGIDEVYSIGTSLIVDLLEELGLDARVANEGDIVVGDCKVSGSAAHLSRDRFLYHATLIIDSNLAHVHELTPPRVDRIRAGEVDPVKYNPCPLTKYVNVDPALVLRVLRRVTMDRGRRLIPLNYSTQDCRTGRGLMYDLLKERVRDPYWVPCGH
ncbi:MAG: lipoate--protein ligase family protein [Crenarchaeota archaeon]|nr:lipoate--protein ligase family protein [Thermoproteota archaeon]